MDKRFEIVPIVTDEAIVSTKPHDPVSILDDRRDAVVWQAILAAYALELDRFRKGVAQCRYTEQRSEDGYLQVTKPAYNMKKPNFQKLLVSILGQEKSQPFPDFYGNGQNSYT